jgi:hypothetical protein
MQPLYWAVITPFPVQTTIGSFGSPDLALSKGRELFVAGRVIAPLYGAPKGNDVESVAWVVASWDEREAPCTKSDC